MRQTAGSFSKFIVVGSIGFLVDAGLLYLLVSQGGDAFIMRMCSFFAALCVTWALNRGWTFAGRSTRAPHHEYLLYALIQTLGAVINVGTYWVVLSIIGVSPSNAVIAIAIGSGVALMFNYLGMRHFVFSPAKSEANLPAKMP